MTASPSAVPRADPARREGIEPVRDPRVTLVELVDTLLDRGLYLNLDVIISVADIPLIGLNLRATLAGMETMLEYGMMRDWDRRTRAWVQRTAARDLPLEQGEELISKMPGGYFAADDFHRDWRPGSVYLTTRRVLVFRRDPREVLWQAPLDSIRTVGVHSETTIGGERIDRLHLGVDGESVAAAGHGAHPPGESQTVLSASAPSRLREMILQHAPTAGRATATQQGPGGADDGTEDSSALVAGHLWFREERAGRPQWRGGAARLDEHGLTWKSPMDARPAIRLAPGQLRAVRHGSELRDEDVPFDDVAVMHLETATGELVLAGPTSRWKKALERFAAVDRLEGDRGKGGGNGPGDR